jgi:hypothetical protein
VFHRNDGVGDYYINQKSGIVVAFIIKLEYFFYKFHKKKLAFFLQLMDIRENLEIREDKIISGIVSSVRSRPDIPGTEINLVQKMFLKTKY